MKEIAVIRYNAGNIQSVVYALERLGIEAVVTDDPDRIRNADKVIFPGVGEASTTMGYLKQKGLDTVISSLTQPVLGICLGLQLMCQFSEEGNTQCLGIFHANVKKFPLFAETDSILKVPHMGWNTVAKNSTDNTLLYNLDTSPFFYFVHSFYATTGPDTAAVTEYGVPFSSVLSNKNFMAVQFHPEKSGLAGEVLLKNFLKL
ncbi:MAG: imidazole glycerol phosphate synthase subunit HisH [Bacteroidales bacterium]|nr:imidazole glycerol phosphate synthase subunit HisH [Bacteroidales bacterium]